MIKDELGDRIKRHENTFRHYLPIRMPVIMRLDGRSFHSYCRGLQKPIDHNLVNAMNKTAIYLCENIQGAQMAYIQSDEISILLNNYQTHDTQGWFDNNIQKMVSISAAMCSTYFTQLSPTIFNGEYKLATFDSRVFIVPKEEVNNAFLSRQQDATRNSIQMLARSMFSHKECNNKNTSQLQEMCWQKNKTNWNDLPTWQKRGRCIIKHFYQHTDKNNKTGEVVISQRSKWIVDDEIPILFETTNLHREIHMNKLKYTITEVKPRMFHLHFKKRYDMCMMFLRYQECYECPNSKFRGQPFTILEYMEWYSQEYGDGIFTYPNDWNGFNIAGNILYKILQPHDNMKYLCECFIQDYNEYDEEMRLVYDICIEKYPDGRFYLLGSTDKGTTLKHEMAHGFFYLNSNYKKQMTKLVKSIDPGTYKAICRRFKDIGYTPKVYIDECQAYLATGYETGYEAICGVGSINRGWLNQESKPFIELFEQYYEQA